MNMEESKDQVIEAQMKVGAQIQKFFDFMQEYGRELKNWKPSDEAENELIRSRENLIYEFMDEYCSLFGDILA